MNNQSGSKLWMLAVVILVNFACEPSPALELPLPTGHSSTKDAYLSQLMRAETGDSNSPSVTVRFYPRGHGSIIQWVKQKLDSAKSAQIDAYSESHFGKQSQYRPVRLTLNYGDIDNRKELRNDLSIWIHVSNERWSAAKNQQLWASAQAELKKGLLKSSSSDVYVLSAMSIRALGKWADHLSEIDPHIFTRDISRYDPLNQGQGSSKKPPEEYYLVTDELTYVRFLKVEIALELENTQAELSTARSTILSESRQVIEKLQKVDPTLTEFNGESHKELIQLYHDLGKALKVGRGSKFDIGKLEKEVSKLQQHLELANSRIDKLERH